MKERVAVKTAYGAGLDAGSTGTRCVIVAVEGGSLRLAGFGEARSAGWQKSRLADPSLAAESIRHAVREAERSAQISVEEAVVGVGGSAIDASHSRGVYEFARARAICTADMSYAVELARRVRLEEDRTLLQVCPQDFTVDGRAGYRNPEGASCTRLEAHAHVVTSSALEHERVIAAVHQAHLGVEETVFEAVAAAYAAILPEERSQGVALADVGAHSTDLVIYDGDSLLSAVSLPLSGDHFTRDIAWGLCVSFEDAQRLKEEYGCAFVGLTNDNHLLEVPSAEGRLARETTRRHLNEILEARAEELFRYVGRELGRVGMEQSLMEGVVLVGGGAQLNGLCDVAERVLNCQARNGLALGIRDWSDKIDTPVWTVAAGLAMYSARMKTYREEKRKAPGFLGLVMRH